MKITSQCHTHLLCLLVGFGIVFGAQYVRFQEFQSHKSLGTVCVCHSLSLKAAQPHFGADTEQSRGSMDFKVPSILITSNLLKWGQILLCVLIMNL